SAHYATNFVTTWTSTALGSEIPGTRADSMSELQSSTTTPEGRHPKSSSGFRFAAGGGGSIGSVRVGDAEGINRREPLEPIHLRDRRSCSGRHPPGGSAAANPARPARAVPK